MQTQFVPIGDRRIVVHNKDDCEAVLKQNHELRSRSQSHIDWGRHIASIPPVILIKWYTEELQRGNVIQMFSKRFQDEVIKRKLQDPEWAFLRTDNNANRVGWTG